MKIAPTPGDATAAQQDAALALLTKAMDLVENKELATAKEICLEIVNNYSDTYAAFNALSLLTQTYDLTEKESAKLNYKTLFHKSKKKLNAIAGLILAELDKENKAKVIEEVISGYKNDDILEQALFEKFLYFFNDMQDRKSAKLVSDELDKLFPNSLTALDAHYQLGDKEYLSKSYLFAQQASENKTNQSSLPTEYALLANYPNPFNPSTSITYELPKDGFVTLRIFDMLGNEVKTLVTEQKERGRYTVQFDASSLASGIYLYQIRASDFVATKKMMLLK